MSKSCAKCQKTVYPLEELKCLDKTWHKGCFKCHDCGMTLNMKTYKGFDKLPYCESHVPKAKATTVADTPEFKRISENTKIQSNAAYHAEFEKSKGKFTQVTDDPELMRIKQNTKIISNVAYHGDLEKKALMEKQRTLGGEGDNKNRNGVPQPKSPSAYMEELSSLPTSSHPPPSSGGSHNNHHNYNSSAHQNTTSSHNRGSNNYHQEEQKSYSRQYAQQPSQPPSHVPQQQYRERDHYNQQQVHQQTPPAHYQQQQQHLNHGAGNPSPYSSRGQPNVIYTSDGGAVNSNSSKKVGSIADYDPLNNYYGSAEQQRATQQSGRMGAGYGHGGGGGGGYPAQGHLQQKQHQPPPPGPPSHGQYSSAIKYRALYDYEAQDVDELSFLESDLIVDCTAIDEGWLTGTNLRSKQRGMLPANYVQPA